jgi:tRNA-2-methylthio-N6-dimethylallyladenosine synthase
MRSGWPPTASAIRWNGAAWVTVTVTVSQAAPFHLIADAVDAQPLRIRRTRAGDAWDLAQAESCAVPVAGSTGGSGAVSLGLPSIRVGDGLV